MTDLVEIRQPEYLVLENDGALQVLELAVEEIDLLEVAEQGPAGPTGAQGAQGIPGVPGLSGANYIHSQGVPSATWTINHGLSRYPSVTVVDSAGSTVVGDVEYVSTNQVILRFSAAFGGSAFLN